MFEPMYPLAPVTRTVEPLGTTVSGTDIAVMVYMLG
jgi:hypothetical protein